MRVNGPDAAPVYQFLKSSKSGFLGSSIKWNFTKFLIDKEGKVIKRYGSTTAPLAIEADIQKALGKVLSVDEFSYINKKRMDGDFLHILLVHI